MSDRPSRLWKAMPLEKRVLAAHAFWSDASSPELEMQRLEVVTAIARQWKFRPQSVLALPVDRRSKQLAHLSEVSDAVATRALVAYHFASQRPLMGAFLDALGVAHENGLITAEDLAAPGADDLRRAVTTLKQTYDASDIDLYLKTLAALDGDTWRALEVVTAS